MRMQGGGGRNRPMLPLHTITVLVAMAVVSVYSPAALVISIDEDCKSFMCVCNLDPLPAEVPSHHHPPPEPVPSPSTLMVVVLWIGRDCERMSTREGG